MELTKEIFKLGFNIIKLIGALVIVAYGFKSLFI